MRKYKLAILSNEDPEDHLNWIKACEYYSNIVNFTIIDLTRDKWFDLIRNNEYDFFLAKPPGLNSLYKQLYDERIYIINDILKLLIYPTLNEILIYENKRFLSYWLKVNNLPHPETHIFYDKKEAKEFIINSKFPLVSKTNIGASGSGVKILYDKKEALDYLNSAFSEKGWRQNTQRS